MLTIKQTSQLVQVVQGDLTRLNKFTDLGRQQNSTSVNGVVEKMCIGFYRADKLYEQGRHLVIEIVCKIKICGRLNVQSLE